MEHNASQLKAVETEPLNTPPTALELSRTVTTLLEQRATQEARHDQALAEVADSKNRISELDKQIKEVQAALTDSLKPKRKKSKGQNPTSATGSKGSSLKTGRDVRKLVLMCLEGRPDTWMTNSEVHEAIKRAGHGLGQTRSAIYALLEDNRVAQRIGERRGRSGPKPTEYRLAKPSTGPKVVDQ